ncbi:hypothetical protein ACKLNR_015327 [Fusarium oxysporum f. sp. zingiberi]
MEAVGAAASIAALAEIALKSFRAASRLAKDFRGAPRELSRLTQQLSILHCELSLLSGIECKASQSDDLLLLPAEIDLLRQALSNANELLSNTLDALQDIQPHKYGSKAKLQWALRNYLCYRGWTPAMLLFQKDFPEVPPEFFELLSCNSFTDIDVQDRYGATVLHRAALWGTIGDINALLRLGASPLLMDTDVGWTPAFGAASMNNAAVLKRLVEVMPPDFVDHIDFRGRTILHIAIESGGLEAIVFALELGADPHQPSQIVVDEGGAAIEVTPYEFADSKGSDIYEVFIRALQIVGHSISTVEEVEVGFMFWDAVERRST